MELEVVKKDKTTRRNRKRNVFLIRVMVELIQKYCSFTIKRYTHTNSKAEARSPLLLGIVRPRQSLQKGRLSLSLPLRAMKCITCHHDSTPVKKSQSGERDRQVAATTIIINDSRANKWNRNQLSALMKSVICQVSLCRWWTDDERGVNSRLETPINYLIPSKLCRQRRQSARLFQTLQMMLSSVNQLYGRQQK